MNYQKRLKAIPAKGLIKDLIDKFSILNGGKSLSLEVFSKSFSIYTSYKIH